MAVSLASPGEEESARVTTAKNAPQNLFDHYHWRGSSFFSYCLYEYFKLVTVKKLSLARYQVSAGSSRL